MKRGGRRIERVSIGEDMGPRVRLQRPAKGDPRICVVFFPSVPIVVDYA